MPTTNYDKFKAEMLTDPKVRKEYNKLAGEFELIAVLMTMTIELRGIRVALENLAKNMTLR